MVIVATAIIFIALGYPEANPKAVGVSNMEWLHMYFSIIYN